MIGGEWRRSKLAVANVAGLRPTPDRVRETLFNWLGQDLSGWRCVDAFAGTGALGLEAASRGATEVTLAERDSVLAQLLRDNVERLGCQSQVKVVQGDGLRLLAQAAGHALDVIFLDPPYNTTLLAQCVPMAAEALAPGGWLYVESPEPQTRLPLGLTVHRELRAGQVCAQLLRKAP